MGIAHWRATPAQRHDFATVLVELQTGDPNSKLSQQLFSKHFGFDSALSCDIPHARPVPPIPHPRQRTPGSVAASGYFLQCGWITTQFSVAAALGELADTGGDLRKLFDSIDADGSTSHQFTCTIDLQRVHHLHRRRYADWRLTGGKIDRSELMFALGSMNKTPHEVSPCDMRFESPEYVLSPWLSHLF